MDFYSLDPELQLLRHGRGTYSLPEEHLQHELENAPIFTHDAFNRVPHVFPQRGLLGSVVRQERAGFPTVPQDERVYVNTSAPSSGVVCGVQGSGKSHTVSCLLECSLIPNMYIGQLPEPLAGVVFHFDEGNGNRPCEAAFLSAPGKLYPMSSCVTDVTVLVSPSNLENRRRVYEDLTNVNVRPLYLSESNLNAGRMLSMMGCDDIERMPLYMHTALSILRRMGSDDFDYQSFKKRLKDAGFNPNQRAMFNMRTDLLDSYLSETAPSVTSFFDQGTLVIVDLSDPFLDGTSASILFDIVLGLFVEWRPDSQRNRKIVVLDEAHKYLSNSESARLTKSILSLIRQQRHLGIRTIISTQEPTVVPATILDLASFIICHKFSSPSWCSHLKRHVSLLDGSKDDTQQEPWFEEVMQLHTGEALLFSPNAVGVLEEEYYGMDSSTARVGVGYLKVQIRPRITLDGGISVMAVDLETSENVPSDNGESLRELLAMLGQESRSQTASQSPVPTQETSPPSESHFTELVPILKEKRSEGLSKPRGRAIAKALREAKPTVYRDAGVKGWTEYIRAAEALGLVEVQPGMPSLGGAWIKLAKRAAKAKKQSSARASNAGPSNGWTEPYTSYISVAAPSIDPFLDLVEVLKSFEAEGVLMPKRNPVRQRLTTLYPSIYERAGVTKWKGFLVAAVERGYVKVGGGADGTGKRWISLP